MTGTQNPIDYRGILGPDYMSILALVKPKYHPAFAHFIETGDRSSKLEGYIGNTPEANQALEMAFKHRAIERELGPNYQNILDLVKPEHHDAFVGFVRTGELDDIFREYLDADLGAQQAIDMAFDHRMKGLRAVGAILAEKEGGGLERRMRPK